MLHVGFSICLWLRLSVGCLLSSRHPRTWLRLYPFRCPSTWILPFRLIRPIFEIPIAIVCSDLFNLVACRSPTNVLSAPKCCSKSGFVRQSTMCNLVSIFRSSSFFSITSSQMWWYHTSRCDRLRMVDKILNEVYCALWVAIDGWCWMGDFALWWEISQKLV